MNPSACLIIAGLVAALTLVFDKKVMVEDNNKEEKSAFKEMMKHHGRMVYRTVVPILGIIITCIVVAARSGQTPNLTNNSYSKIAGLEFVGFIVVFLFAAIFGLITALIIKGFLSTKVEEDKKDENKVERP